MPPPSRRRRRRAGPGHLTLLLALLAAAALRPGCRRAPLAGRPGPLSGLVVVLDPGHGGADPGAAHGGLVESELTYRMAAILRRELERAGARVAGTVVCPALEVPVAEGAEPPLAPTAGARFQVGGAPVQVSGLYLRAEAARRVWEGRGPGERVVFVSLHFDARPGTRSRGGIVCYDSRQAAPPALARRLVEGLERSGMAAGDGSHLVPRALAVLNPERNPVPERVLVELATLTSPVDRAAVRRSAWRWKAARMVVAALKERRRP